MPDKHELPGFRGLEVIAGFKFLQATTLILAGLGSFGLMNSGVSDAAGDWIETLAAGNGHRFAVAAALGVVFVLLQTFEQLADTFVTAIVPFYALAVAAIFVVRKRPNYDPPFRTPLYPIVPALFILATCFLLGNALLDPSSRMGTLAVLAVIVLGVPVYYATVGRVAPPQRA